MFTILNNTGRMARVKVLRTSIVFILIILVSGINIHAQLSAAGVPRGETQSTLKSIAVVPTFTTMSIDSKKLLEEDLQSPIPERFSVFEDVIIDIRQQGVEIDLPEEQGRVWLYSIESKDALSVQLFFKNFLLPDGAELFIYNQDLSIVGGAFTSHNNNKKNQLMIANLADKHLTVEYFEPYGVDFEGFVELGSIGLAYKEFLGELSFEDNFGYLNINIPEGEAWQNEKHSVCKISFRRNETGYICSGGLLNNSRSDGEPYFLTADHCIDDPAVAETVVAYFNYEIYGGSGETSAGLSLSGAELLKNSSETDFCLLLLNETPNSAYQPYYAPWDATNHQDSSSVGIHHPHGFPKRMSIAEAKTISYDQDISWEGGSVTEPDSHWEVLFNQGTTAGGSSGSPLFNSDKHQVIGQLHGGSDEDYYGKFSQSYIFNSQNNISQYLDPDNLGLVELEDGYYPATNLPDPQIFPKFYKVCEGVPVQLTGMSAFDPISWSWSFTPASVSFANGTDANSKEPFVRFNSSGLYGVTLEVTNAAGTKERWFPGSVMVGDEISIKIQPFANEDSCLINFDSIRLEANGAQDYLWQFSDIEEENFYFVDNTVNPVTIKMKKFPEGSLDLFINLLGSHGSCSEQVSYTMPLTQQSNDSIKYAIEIFYGDSEVFSNKCASIEDNEPIPPITSCTGNSWCDEFGTGEDILGNSIWFYFIPEESKKYRIASNGMDNQIAVYSAESVEALLDGNYELMGANDDYTERNANPVVFADLIEGEKYLIQVDGSAGNIEGEFYFNIRFATGIQASSIVDKKHIKIYPQPVSDLFQVEFDAFRNSKIIVSNVYDISGSLIQTRNYTNLSNNTLEINSTYWSGGIYFIRFRVDNLVYTEKVVKF
jgi:hypothetical protein